jgi:hypothetical protein
VSLKQPSVASVCGSVLSRVGTSKGVGKFTRYGLTASPRALVPDAAVRSAFGDTTVCTPAPNEPSLVLQYAQAVLDVDKTLEKHASGDPNWNEVAPETCGVGVSELLPQIVNTSDQKAMRELLKGEEARVASGENNSGTLVYVTELRENFADAAGSRTYDATKCVETDSLASRLMDVYYNYLVPEDDAARQYKVRIELVDTDHVDSVLSENPEERDVRHFRFAASGHVGLTPKHLCRP